MRTKLWLIVVDHGGITFSRTAYGRTSCEAIAAVRSFYQSVYGDMPKYADVPVVVVACETVAYIKSLEPVNER